jgi:hypothetical protein
VYELAMEYAVDKPGRYALRLERQLGSEWVLVEEPGKAPVLEQVEGLVATGIRPFGTAGLPLLEKTGELRLRLFLEAMDNDHRGKGRPVFRDFATDQGTIGSPADSREVFTVGAAGLDGKAQPYSAAGPPADLPLFRKPDFLAYDALRLGPEGTGGAYGTSLANAFAAGMAATLLSSGMSPAELRAYLHRQCGGVLQAPKRK